MRFKKNASLPLIYLKQKKKYIGHGMYENNFGKYKYI